MQASLHASLAAAQPTGRAARRAKNFEKAKRERESLRLKLAAARAEEEGAPVAQEAP